MDLAPVCWLRAGLGEKCVIPINPDTGSITGSAEARIAWKLKTGGGWTGGLGGHD